MKGTTFQLPTKKPAAAVPAPGKKKRKWTKVLVVLEDEDDEDSDATPLPDGDKRVRKRPVGKGIASRPSMPPLEHHLGPHPPFRG